MAANIAQSDWRYSWHLERRDALAPLAAPQNLPKIAFTMMKLWTRLLLAALMVCQLTAAQSASENERLQRQDRLNTGILPPAGSAAWQAADQVRRSDLDVGTLHVRSQEREDRYLALRQVRVDDLSVGMQYPLVADGAMHAMQLTFSMLLLVISALLYWQSRKKVFGLMGLLGLLLGLYHLQLGGAFIGVLGDDLHSFVKLNAAMTVVLDCAGLYASAKVLASTQFKLRYARSFSALLGGSLLLTVLAYSSRQGAFNLAAVVLLSVALYGFCWDCARQWLQQPAWRKGVLNHLLVAVFLLMVATNLGLWGDLLAPAAPMAWAEPLRVINLPLISLGLVLTLLWRQQRTQSVKDRRQQAHVQKLQEQSSSRFLQQLFISMLVHEIKTPLTVVQLGASALVKQNIAPERKQAWDVRMQTAINSMVHILDNCSQADRYDGGVMAVSLSHFLLTDTLDLVMGQAGVHSSAQSEILQLRIEKPIDGLRLHSDASYLQIILNNLLSNALKYSAQGSPVVLQVSQFASGQGAPMVQFAIRNVKGPAGHPDPAKVFERYYRSPTTSSISGTGLGLWLSQQLAWRLGTTIQLSLEAEQVVFWFTVPVDSAGATSA
jgi:signal transduction histidine kinase